MRHDGPGDPRPGRQPSRLPTTPATSSEPKHLTELHNLRLSMTERGYAFERFLADLFKASDLGYRGSYKVGAQQIDGAFKHGGGTIWLRPAGGRNLPLPMTSSPLR